MTHTLGATENILSLSQCVCMWGMCVWGCVFHRACVARGQFTELGSLLLVCALLLLNSIFNHFHRADLDPCDT